MMLASPRGLPQSSGRTAIQALACYTGLLRMLRSPRWKRLLHTHVDRLREARELDGPVLELLTAESTCPHGLLLLQRKRLEVLAHKRLGQLTAQGATTLDEVLGHLEAWVRAPVPQPPLEDEPVLLEDSQGWRQILSWPGTWLFGLVVLTNRHGLERHGNPAPLLIVGAVLALYYHLRCRGRFWLTTKRLLWVPRFGEPVQVSLDSISRDGVSALPAWGEVRVEGERILTVRHVKQAGRLSALLELHRRSPFLGVADGVQRVGDVAVLPAEREHAEGTSRRHAEPGVAVLRPGYAAFLPSQRSTEIFRGLAGRTARASEGELTVEMLVEQLRLLPETDFDARLREAVLASGGELWTADELRSRAASESGKVMRFGARGVGMQMRPDALQAEAADRIVRRWAA